MTPEQEAATIAASDQFRCNHAGPHDPDTNPCTMDPAGVVHGLAMRAASARAAGLLGQSQRLTRVASLLADEAGLDKGQVLSSLVSVYARAHWGGEA